MNCRQVQSQIFAARDGAPDASSAAAVEGHVAYCAACRQVRDDLGAAFSAWRADSARAIVPDAEREWHAVRRQIRGGAGAGDTPARSRRNIFVWLGLPLAVTAAAAVALIIVMPPRPSDARATAGTGHVITARADHVEAPGNNASTMVIVDDRSGWVIVWASDGTPKSG